MSRGTGRVLPPAVRRAIIRHAREAYPLECCGLLVGRGPDVTFAVRMQNVDASPVRYRLDDRAHIELRKVLRAFAPTLSIVGVYHSHPNGTAEPSRADCAEALYPDWLHVIVGLGARRAAVQAFRIRGGHAHAVRLR